MVEKHAQDFKLAIFTAILASIIPTIGAVWAGAQFVSNANTTKETVDKILNRLDSIEQQFHQSRLSRAEETGRLDGRILRLETIVKQPVQSYARKPSPYGREDVSNGG